LRDIDDLVESRPDRDAGTANESVVDNNVIAVELCGGGFVGVGAVGRRSLNAAGYADPVRKVLEVLL
jgi:hypothetical protein